jgi:hypothetical protein
MKFLLGVLFCVVGFLVQRVGDLGGFTQFGGSVFTYWAATGCYTAAGGLLMFAAREYLKKRLYPDA